MHIILIALHVSAMVASLVLVFGAVLLALRGVKQSMHIARSGMITSVFGLVTGVTLLLSSPAPAKCMVLSAYLVVMIVIYRYGFGWGQQSKARLFKSTS